MVYGRGTELMSYGTTTSQAPVSPDSRLRGMLR
jgi:hypothetical protein